MAGSTVGLVVVSHSRALAHAAVALAQQMVEGKDVRFAVAAGLDDETLGTDAVQIQEAIEEVDGDAGVVVLMDLGSAVLSTELALDLLTDQSIRERVTLSAAPLVEGLVMAAVSAAAGASRQEIAAEADQALLGKQGQLGLPNDAAVADADSAAAGGSGGSSRTGLDQIVAVVDVRNAHGLHARPAARIVAEVAPLDAVVTLANLTTGAAAVPAASLSRVTGLGAVRGHQLEIRASGPQAQEAVDRLVALAERGFDDSEGFDDSDGSEHSEDGDDRGEAGGTGSAARSSSSEVASDSSATREVGPPIGVSPGIVIGPVRTSTAPDVDPSELPTGDPTTEWQRMTEALTSVRGELEHRRDLTAKEIGAAEAGIFDAHLALLADPEVLGGIRDAIAAGVGAGVAWDQQLSRVEQEWAALADPYLRERAADVRSVRRLGLRALAGESSRARMEPGVLVARDLDPADAATLDGESVQGVVLAAGSATSHSSILVRLKGIPLVVNAGLGVLEWPEGATVALDGGTGELHLEPTGAVRQGLEERREQQERQRADDLAHATAPALSRDGVAFTVAANLGSVADAREAARQGADGSGLIRTEFLFLDREQAPTEAEQQASYRELVDALPDRSLTFRTLDVGGDKPLPYLPAPREDNPFLGVRGLRLSLRDPRLLEEQLRALLHAARSAAAPVEVMFPMVTEPGELREAVALLDRAADTNGAARPVRVGMMVEVPAAALKLAAFLPHLDFVSIGTNDLTQYTMAAERGNPGVAALSDGLDPAVLRLVDEVCRAAAGTADVSVCGELGGDEQALPVLVGLGVRKVSVAPRSVPRVKAALRALSVADCEGLARRALDLGSAAEVRALVAAQ